MRSPRAIVWTQGHLRDFVMIWSWKRTIDTTAVVGIIGGLAAAFWALAQYGHQVEQQSAETIRHAIEITHDSTADKFRDDLRSLVAVFYTQDVKEFWEWKNDNGKEPSLVFYQQYIFTPYNDKFEFVSTYFLQMYDYAKSSRCTWDVIADSLRQDAGNFIYYFQPTWDAYARRIHREPRTFSMSIIALYENTPPPDLSITCGAITVFGFRL
jgi:hypothetical protein